MKRSELVKVTEFLQQYRKISSIQRVDDSVLKIFFDSGLPLFVDLSRNDSYMFIKDDFKRAKLYNSPFDIILNKRFSYGKIESIEVEEGNRILRLCVLASSSYKAMRTTLQSSTLCCRGSMAGKCCRAFAKPGRTCRCCS